MTNTNINSTADLQQFTEENKASDSVSSLSEAKASKEGNRMIFPKKFSDLSIFKNNRGRKHNIFNNRRKEAKASMEKKTMTLEEFKHMLKVINKLRNCPYLLDIDLCDSENYRKYFKHIKCLNKYKHTLEKVTSKNEKILVYAKKYLVKVNDLLNDYQQAWDNWQQEIDDMAHWEGIGLA